MKSELARKGWLKRLGRHAVDLLVGSFPSPVIRQIDSSESSSFGKFPNEGRSSFGKNPNGKGSSFGNFPETDSSPLTADKKKAAAATAAAEELLKEVDEEFVRNVISAAVYSEEMVRWVYGKLRLHCAASGALPVRKQLLHWMANERGLPPLQPSLFDQIPAAGAVAANFGGKPQGAVVTTRREREPNPECLLCRGSGEVAERPCTCTDCAICFGSGMEVVAGKGARRCRCRQPSIAQQPAAIAPAGDEEQDLTERRAAEK
jgi:hypothetical protein